MAHVSNPNVAGPSSSLGGGGGGSSSSKKAIEVPSWPESIQVRLKELEAEFDDEEITKKGFWKQKYKLVETFLTKNQIKDVAALHEDYKSGNVTDVDYFKKLAGLLAPVETCIDEGVKEEDEAMICEESPETVKAEKAPSGSLGDAEELPSESSYKVWTGLSTGYAEYYLMEPSEMYQPLMNAVTEKTFLAKHVIEYLEKAIDPNNHMDAEYEDLLNHLGLIVPPVGMNPIGDETLLRHADFVVNQVSVR